MSANIAEIIASRRSWFKDWFNSEFYHKLYANRDEDEAASFVKVLLQELEPHPGESILDLGCGTGRHAKHLAANGYQVTGIDLSFSSIQYARQWQTERLQFFVHDMRESFGVNCFDCVFNFFTSFGYFKSENENESVIKNISRALKPGGWLMMDYMNVIHTEKQLVAHEQREIDGIKYDIKRWADNNHIHKSIEIDIGLGNPLLFTEKVMRLGQNDFDTMFKKNGLELQKVYGDYALNDWMPELSPRLILLARKTSV